MEEIVYTFRTENKQLLWNQLGYVEDELIPSYKADGYKIRVLWVDSDGFGLITNCSYIFNSDKLGDYTYTEQWVQNGELVGINKYVDGKLVDYL